MTFFKNTYRIETTRLQKWDYASNGYYYITICTKNREYLFGEIIKGEMQFSDIGEIILREWCESFNIRAELFCDCYVIMPNHIHGVVVIDKRPDPVETHGRASLRDRESPRDMSTSQTGKPVVMRAPKSISSFVAGFKSAATKQINEYRNTPRMPVWQPRFHDHIVRDEKDLNRIRKYINHNPMNWNEDDYYGETEAEQ